MECNNPAQHPSRTVLANDVLGWQDLCMGILAFASISLDKNCSLLAKDRHFHIDSILGHDKATT